MDGLLHQQRANVAIIQGFQAEQGFIDGISLIGIKGQTEPWCSLANGLDPCDAFMQITARLDLETADTLAAGCFSQFIAISMSQRRNAQIGVDRTTGSPEKDVQRDA